LGEKSLTGKGVPVFEIRYFKRAIAVPNFYALVTEYNIYKYGNRSFLRLRQIVEIFTHYVDLFPQPNFILSLTAKITPLIPSQNSETT